MIPGVTGLPEPPIPLFRRIECLAGHLPIEEIRFFCFIAVGLHADVFFLFAYPLDLTQCFIEIVAMEIMKGRDRKNEVEMLIRKRQGRCTANLKTVTDLFLGVFDSITGDINARHFNARDNSGQIIELKTLPAAYIKERLGFALIRRNPSRTKVLFSFSRTTISAAVAIATKSRYFSQLS